MKIVVQFFEGCHHWRLATERVGEAVRQAGRDHQPIELQTIETTKRLRWASAARRPFSLTASTHSATRPLLSSMRTVGLRVPVRG